MNSLYTERMKIEDAVFVYRLSDGDRLSWHGRYHAHTSAEYEIHYFVEGSGSFLCNRTRYPVSPGNLFLSGPREFHSIIRDQDSTPLSWYAVLFSVDPASSPSDERIAAELEAAFTARRNVLTIDTNFRFQFEDLLQMTRSADSALHDAAVHLLSSFLLRWFGRRGSGMTGSVADGPVDGARKNSLHIDKALSLMQKSVREHLKIEDIAWKLGLSEEHFIRIFREEVRMTPLQYFTRLKVEGASGLLMSTDKSIGEISEWFGFENQFHFSRIFKKCTGVSPLEYRKTYLQLVDFH